MKKNDLNHLIQENYKKIFLLSMKMLKNYEDAEDVTQEVFMKAYQNIDKFRKEAKFSTWLYRIALNHIYNFKSDKKKHQNLNFYELHSKNNETPETVLLEKELHQKLQKTIDELPKAQKEVFVLRHYNGFSFNKIAKILSRKIGTAKSNYFFAMQKIKRELQKKSLLEFKD